MSETQAPAMTAASKFVTLQKGYDSTTGKWYYTAMQFSRQFDSREAAEQDAKDLINIGAIKNVAVAQIVSEVSVPSKDAIVRQLA